MRIPCFDATMPGTAAMIRRTVERMPQWLRTELCATDLMLRERAEDALSAMIAAAIGTDVANDERGLTEDGAMRTAPTAA